MEFRPRVRGGAEAAATVVLAGRYAALASPPQGGGCQGWNRRAVATVALWMAWWTPLVTVLWASDDRSMLFMLDSTEALATGRAS